MKTIYEKYFTGETGIETAFYFSLALNNIIDLYENNIRRHFIGE